MEFEYFRVEDSEQFSFYRVSLSRKNGWVDAEGYVYIVYTNTELEEMLHLSHATVIKLFHELDTKHGIRLIERRQVGCNHLAVIYVKNFVKPFPAGLDENGLSGSQNNRSPAFKKLEVRASKILNLIILILIRLRKKILRRVRERALLKKNRICVMGALEM